MDILKTFYSDTLLTLTKWFLIHPSKLGSVEMCLNSGEVFYFYSR